MNNYIKLEGIVRSINSYEFILQFNDTTLVEPSLITVIYTDDYKVHPDNKVIVEGILIRVWRKFLDGTKQGTFNIKAKKVTICPN